MFDDFLGIDIEKSDRSVGIFSDVFCLVFKSDDDRQIQIYFGEEQMQKLVDLMRPFVQTADKRIEWEEKNE